MTKSATQLESPVVSVILPTYNRAQFLPQAIESIRSQRFTDWELVIVDDGSTDETAELLPRLTADIPQPVRIIWQENQGAYAARNTGLDHAMGRYIAFFDSDDIWLAHHLRDCVAALDANPDIDWVYGACQVVVQATAKVLSESTFYVDRRPRPFMRLKHRMEGRLQIIDDVDATRCMITYGLYNGLQNSVIRRSVFDVVRFEGESRNEAEDQLIVIRYLAGGRQVGFFDNVHVIYHIHEANSSAAAQHGDIEKRLRIQRVLLERFERLAAEIPLSNRELCALRHRLAREHFWLLGYSLLWESGRRHEALQSFRRGIRYAPWNLRFWKTLLWCQIRCLFANRATQARKNEMRPCPATPESLQQHTI